MYKKLFALVVVFAMTMTLGLLPAAAAETTSFGIMNPANVADGSDECWTKQNGISLYSDETNGSGLIASPGSGSVSTEDKAFSSTTKRGWGNIASKNIVNAEETSSYTLTFKLTSVEGMYVMNHGGCYVYLRSENTGNNYLANKMAIVLRRNWQGISQIALKPSNSGAMSAFIDVTNDNVDLGNTTVKIVDNFVTDIINVYATDAEDEYVLIGKVALDTEANGATLTNASGTTQSYTAYATDILEGASKPMFLLNEYSGMISSAEISYPAEGPCGAPASIKGGVFVKVPEVTLTVTDDNSTVWYTVDGTDPIENEDGRNLYFADDVIEFDVDDSELPTVLTLKTVEEQNGQYSDVLTYTYTVYPENAKYTLNPSEVLNASSNDFAYINGFKTYTIDSENDAFGVGTWNWSHIKSKFAVPAAAKSMEYNFDITGLNNDGATMYGVFLSFEALSTEVMTSKTVPYIYFTRNGIGFRKNETWSGNASVTVAWPQGIKLDTAKHHFRVITTFGGKTLFYVDDVYAATFEIAEDGTLTVTNADGAQASRTGAVRATEKAYANLCIYNSTSENLKVQNFDVSYPASKEVYPTASIDLETVEAYVGGESIRISPVVSDENALVYYTLDGTLPTEESDLYDGSEIVIPSAEAAGTKTLKIRPYNGYWGPVDTLKINYKEKTVKYSYDFNDEEISSDWGQFITAGSTTKFALTEDYKLTSQSGWSMLSYNKNIASGKTNTVSFDLKDNDAAGESGAKFAYALRCIQPSEWFNDVPSNSHTYLMFEGNKLGFKTGASAASEEAYSMIEVDADFTNETRVTIVDDTAGNIAGIYVSDTAGTSPRKLIAYVKFENYNDGSKDYARASLYSMLGGKVENVDFRRERTTAESFRPTFMTLNAEGLFTLDNVEITVDNVDAPDINTLGAPTFEELATGSDYFKAVKISKVGEGNQQIYYTTDGSEPSAENGKAYTDGTYIVITDSSTIKAVAQKTDSTACSAVTAKTFNIKEAEYFKAEFEPKKVYDGESVYWTQGSNNTAGIPSIKVNDDGSFTFAGSESETGGGVGMIATKRVFNADENPVTFTEFDAKKLGTGKNHVAFCFGMRRESNGGVQVTNNQTFFIKLSGSQIGFKNESWGAMGESYLDTGTSYNSDSSDYVHYIFVDDKVNNTVWLFADGAYLGKYVFSTTEKENDTVTLTSALGKTLSRTYSDSISTSGQFFIGQAYQTTNSFKNLITYSGNTVPKRKVTFDVGDYGVLDGEETYLVSKYGKLERVPNVTMNVSGEFLGWTAEGENTVYSTEQILNIVITEDIAFQAKYKLNTLEGCSVEASLTGTAPVFMTALELSGNYSGEYSIYYTTDGSEPSAQNGILWNGNVCEFSSDTTVKAIAIATDSKSAVAEINVDVNEKEMFKAVLDNKYMAKKYSGTRADEGYFVFNDNRGDIVYSNGVTANEDGTLHVDGTNNQPKGSGVSVIFADEDFAQTAETAVYSFDVKNASVSAGKAFQAIYFGVRATSPNYGSLVSNNNPIIVLKDNRIGFKNGTWGGDCNLYGTISGYKGITASDWVNIKIIDDRTTNIITVLGDNKVIGTYKIEGKNFTFEDVSGESHTTTYSKDIAENGQFWLGSAYCSMDLNNVTEYTGVTRPECTVKFEMGDFGTTSEQTEYTVTKFNVVPNVPEPEKIAKHYKFAGWKKNDADRIYTSVEAATAPIDGSVVFTAQYSKVFTDVSIKASDVSVEEGRKIVVPVKLESQANVTGTVTVEYNSEQLVYVESDGSVTDNGNGTLSVAYAGNGTVNITFKSVDGKVGDTYGVNIGETSLTGSDGEFLNTSCENATVTIKVLLGDVDRNGKITVYDSVAVLKHIAGIETLQGDALAAAAVGGNEEVTVSDAITILKYIARIIQSF